MICTLNPKSLTLRVFRYVCQSSAGFGFQTELRRVVAHIRTRH
jgi:hypothetical protein